MSGPTNPPTFLPKQPPILITGAGLVLTVTEANTQIAFASGGGVAERYPVTLAAGTTDNLNPGNGWPGNGLGARLLLDPSAGAATLTGLVAGSDGMLVLIWNTAAIGGNNITFNNLDAGSDAANQFDISSATFILIPQSRTVAVYDMDIGKWSIG
ncbi:MAG: hypothetical protein WBR29_03060 [Gammaproteobacteria bacterium]